MAVNISLFPVLTEEMIKKIRFQSSDYRFYYMFNEHERDLVSEEIDNSIINHRLIDKSGIWTPDEYNIGISRSYSLRTYNSLFGECGIACKNATIGLAILWTSSDSRQRGVIEIGEINNSREEVELDVNYEFDIAQLRGNVELTTVMYIKESGTPTWREEHLANTYGCILGELDKYIIQLDGIGSVFPIYEINEAGQPLWYIKCEWDDPTYDCFSEKITIYINKAHSSYRYLDRTKKTFDKQLLKEIISSAISIIISKIKQDENYWNATLEGIDLQQGSVSEAVNYFINTFQWDVSSPELMSLSIRKFFDQRMI
ncbi:hypothetical protein [Clostridium sp.]|uniref:hypothetical protein n=1 Tax=Clostridium sp. TaxID=1506 RepID=UPI002903EEF5|nr:hypothetical protein [Clostridium sp.]MDU1969224.1 hypothetical protein [Clostridium perfringens]MDU1825044.1 hypothetical protein [Clostridium sp.]MDU1841394.1 hypothetical protein [Clostridium sp.]MDU2689795.1 hypothetical protein [Clostridium sp.]MDU2957890.1 hypothetical protein [Clostridium sp.]